MRGLEDAAAAGASARLSTVRRLAGRLGRVVASTRLDIVLLNHAPVLLRLAMKLAQSRHRLMALDGAFHVFHHGFIVGAHADLLVRLLHVRVEGEPQLVHLRLDLAEPFLRAEQAVGEEKERTLYLKINALLIVEPDPVPVLYDSRISALDRAVTLRELQNG